MTPSDPWLRELRESQDQARKQAGYLARARASRAALFSRRTSSRGWRRGWAALALASTFAAALLGVGAWHRAAHRDLRFWTGGAAGQAGQGVQTGEVGSWVAAPDTSALALGFSDGTLFRLSPGSRARVSAVDANGARIVVERGRVSAAVVHRAASRWLIDVGPFEVLVVGTRFDVSWDPNDEEFRLQLREGSVLVSGACVRNPTPLVEGHALRVTCQPDREEIEETLADGLPPRRDPSTPAAPTVTPPTVASALDSGEAAQPLATAPAVAGERRGRGGEGSPPKDVLRSPAWRASISAGRFREALDLATQSGFDDVCRRASGADLLELGDAARLAGEHGLARQAYLAARGKLPRGGRSAYSLGLTAFDQDKDFALAAHWFDTYLSEQPAGDLRQESEGRLMEAWLRAGEREKARTVAAVYLRDYPAGTQASLARQIAAP